MKKAVVSLVFGALALTAASAANARVDVSIGLNPFGFGYAPPVVYQPAPYYDPYYSAPAGVYIGGGSWGGDRGRRGGDRGGRGGRGGGRGGHH